MKKFILIVFIIGLASFGYVFYKNYNKKEEIPVLDIEEEKLVLDDIYIYGTSLNLSGMINLPIYDDIKLTLYNGKFKDYDVIYEDGIISLSDYVNDGLKLDNISKGDYDLFLKVSYEADDNGEKKLKYKYYAIDNNTEYKEMTYYTMSKYNNKITINSDNSYGTLRFNIKENKDKDIYDITIDPGHGGMDGGASVGSYCEDDFTLKIAESLKSKLENYGFKVKLTREEGDLSDDKIMEEYGKHGRAVISNEVFSKYTFSIHLNSNKSSYVSGLEIYTPDNINYDFINNMASKIIEKTGIGPSTNKTYKKYDGVYTRNFTSKEIEADNNKKIEKGYKAYDITEKSNYFYMIRETGGKITGSYVDDRNPEISAGNPYVKSNIGNETYLLEYGYLTNENDLNIIVNKIEEYTSAIADAINDNMV